MQTSKTTASRRRYTAEFKSQAVELVGLGRSVDEVAQEFGIGSSVLYSWVRKDPKLGVIGSGGVRGEADDAAADELPKLRRQIAHLKMENDILKKAAVILGTKLPSGAER